MAVKVEGMQVVLRNLNREIAGIRGRTRAGLAKAALLIRRGSQERSPVDTGNLKASAYTQPVGAGARAPQYEIGHTASYAPFVHENLRARHTVGEAKFLEKSVKENAGEVVEIIREHASV